MVIEKDGTISYAEKEGARGVTVSTVAYNWPLLRHLLTAKQVSGAEAVLAKM